MKKLFVCISLALTAILCLSGCGFGGGGGCSGGGPTTPSYSTVWSNDKSEAVGLTETLKYSVKYDDNLTVGKSSYQNKIDKSVLDFDYLDGTYQTNISVVQASKDLIGENESEILTEIVDSTDASMVKRIFKYTTRLDLPFKYKFGEMTDYVVNNDYIQTETYMLLTANSFSPIFTKNTTFITFVGVGKSVTVERQHYDSVTVYNKKNLSTTTTVYYTKDGDGYVSGDVANSRTTTSKYDFKSVLDNSTLLFALRALSREGTLPALKVYSHVYTSPKTLTLAGVDPVAEKFNITLNGTTIPEEEIQLDGYSFVLNTASGCTTGPNTGKAQLVYINKKADTAPASIGSNRPMVMRYVEPLMEYSSYNSMGALVYSLVEINF